MVLNHSDIAIKHEMPEKRRSAEQRLKHNRLAIFGDALKNQLVSKDTKKNKVNNVSNITLISWFPILSGWPFSLAKQSKICCTEVRCHIFVPQHHSCTAAPQLHRSTTVAPQHHSCTAAPQLHRSTTVES